MKTKHLNTFEESLQYQSLRQNKTQVLRENNDTTEMSKKLSIFYRENIASLRNKPTTI